MDLLITQPTQRPLQSERSAAKVRKRALGSGAGAPVRAQRESKPKPKPKRIHQSAATVTYISLIFIVVFVFSKNVNGGDLLALIPDLGASKGNRIWSFVDDFALAKKITELPALRVVFHGIRISLIFVFLSLSGGKKLPSFMLSVSSIVDLLIAKSMKNSLSFSLYCMVFEIFLVALFASLHSRNENKKIFILLVLFVTVSVISSIRIEFIFLFLPLIIGFIGSSFTFVNAIILLCYLIISFSIMMLIDHKIGIPAISFDIVNKVELLKVMISNDYNLVIPVFIIALFIWIFVEYVPTEDHLLLMSLVLTVLCVFYFSISSIFIDYFFRSILIHQLLRTVMFYIISHQRPNVSYIISVVYLVFAFINAFLQLYSTFLPKVCAILK